MAGTARDCALLDYFADAGADWPGNAEGTLTAADYRDKNVVIIGLGLTRPSCVDFCRPRRVTPRVMGYRATPPGLDKRRKRLSVTLAA